MKNNKLTPVAYDYRYANLSDTMRNRIMDSRHNLFYRNNKSLKTSTNRKQTAIAILTIIILIIAFGYTISALV